MTAPASKGLEARSWPQFFTVLLKLLELNKLHSFTKIQRIGGQKLAAIFHSFTKISIEQISISLLHSIAIWSNFGPNLVNGVSVSFRCFLGICFPARVRVWNLYGVLSQLFNLLWRESAVRSRTNRWQIPLKSSSNYSPTPPSVNIMISWRLIKETTKLSQHGQSRCRSVLDRAFPSISYNPCHRRTFWAKVAIPPKQIGHKKNYLCTGVVKHVVRM